MEGTSLRIVQNLAAKIILQVRWCLEDHRP